MVVSGSSDVGPMERGIVTGAGTRKPPRLWPWIVVLVVGFVLAPIGVAVYVSKSVVPLFSNTSRATPAVFSQHLDPGTYYVFEQQGDFGSPGVPAPIGPAQVVVESQDGARLEVFTPGGIDLLGIAGASFRSVVGFTVDATGNYVVHVRNTDASSVPVMVAPSYLTALTRNLGWLWLSGVGVLVFLAGLILLIVRSVERSKQRRNPSGRLRCANGHALASADRFCGTCGVPAPQAPTATPTPLGAR